MNTRLRVIVQIALIAMLVGGMYFGAATAINMFAMRDYILGSIWSFLALLVLFPIYLLGLPVWRLLKRNFNERGPPR